MNRVRYVFLSLFFFTCWNTYCYSSSFSHFFHQTIRPYSQFSFGPQAYYCRLEEESVPSDQTHFRGAMAGGRVEYEFRREWAFYLNMYFSFSEGSLTNGTKNKRIIHHQNVEGQFGYTFPLSDRLKVDVTPFFGFGFRYFNEYVHGPGDFALAYKNYYVPIGFILTKKYKDCLIYGVKVIGLLDVDSIITISFQKGVCWKITNQNNLQVELPISYRLGNKKQFEMKLLPFFSYLRNGKPAVLTNIGTTLGIAHQISYSWGSYFLIGYVF